MQNTGYLCGGGSELYNPGEHMSASIILWDNYLFFSDDILHNKFFLKRGTQKLSHRWKPA